MKEQLMKKELQLEKLQKKYDRFTEEVKKHQKEISNGTH